MNKLTTVVMLTALLALPTLTEADCAFDQKLCNARCTIVHFDDGAAKAGCKSRCLAERAACSTKAGTQKALDLGKDAVRDTRSFIDGLTEDKSASGSRSEAPEPAE